MFDSVRNNKRIVQVFLALITLPFALWGVDSYIRGAGAGADLAVVGDSKITPQDYGLAMRDQADRMRQQLGAQFDQKMLETPQARRAVLDNLINQRLILLAVRDAKLVVTDASLAEFIARQPVFQEDGKFSPERYAALVASRGMSKDAFEHRIRQDMLQQQLVQPIVGGTISNKAATTSWAKNQLEQRLVATLHIAPEQYVSGIKIDEAQVAAHYEANKAAYETPEQVKLDYVVLDRAVMETTAKVADADVEARYKADEAKYVAEESRRASHILLKLAADAPEAEVAAVQAKAKEIEAALEKNPKAFGDLATKHSADPGSAQKGGDLGWFGRGAMVKPFEDAVFSMTDGQTSAPVRSDFGLHIIRVTGIKPKQVRALSEVRGDIVAQLRKDAAARQFAEAVEAFGNTVYEQPDSLQPAVDKWSLPVRHTDWLSKGGKLPPPFDNAKLSSAIFSADAVERKHNIEAVEIAPGKMLAARVAEHRVAALQPLDVVRTAIRAKLAREQAVVQAKANGEAMLKTLQSGGKVDGKFAAAQAVLRAAPVGIKPEAARAVFLAQANKLPAYVGDVSDDGGYDVYRIEAVTSATDDDPRIAILTEQYQRVVSEVELQGYLAALRERFTVKINDKALESLTTQ